MATPKVLNVTSDIWEVADSLRLPGGVTFPLRMTIIRRPHGGLWLHSPVTIDDATAAAIDELGTVQDIVAPTKMHSLFVQATVDRWPTAKVTGCPGYDEAHPDIRVDATYAEGVFGPDIDAVLIEGAPMLNELVFLHRPSRTLLVSDLIFNFAPANFATSVILRVIGCHSKMMASRSWGWFFSQDRNAVEASVERILELDFDRLIPCHGRRIDTDAQARLAVATQRLRPSASKR